MVKGWGGVMGGSRFNSHYGQKKGLQEVLGSSPNVLLILSQCGQY